MYDSSRNTDRNSMAKLNYNLTTLYYLGILETIFDGIQRPLETISKISGSVFVPRGVDVPSLDQHKNWDYTPLKGLKVEALISGGDMLGSVYENELFNEHRIMVAPNIRGRIISLEAAGNYTVADPIAVIETVNGERKSINMSHFWPVRNPRPAKEKLPGNNPLLTGQRVLDALFPTVQGGTCAIPGAFGCGKTCISQALSKYSNSDCIIYVGCGERGNEMAEVLADFPALKTTINDKQYSIM